MRLFNRMFKERPAQYSDEVLSILHASGAFDAEDALRWIRTSKGAGGGAVQVHHLTKWSVLQHTQYSYYQGVTARLMERVHADMALTLAGEAAREAYRKFDREELNLTGIDMNIIGMILRPPDTPLILDRSQSTLHDILARVTGALAEGTGLSIDPGGLMYFVASILGTVPIDTTATGPWRDMPTPSGGIWTRWKKRDAMHPPYHLYQRGMPFDVPTVMRQCIQDAFILLYAMETSANFTTGTRHPNVPAGNYGASGAWFGSLVELLLFLRICYRHPIAGYVMSPDKMRALYTVVALLLGKASSHLVQAEVTMITSIPTRRRAMGLDEILLPLTIDAYPDAYNTFTSSSGIGSTISGAQTKLFREKMEIFNEVPSSLHTWLRNHHYILGQFGKKYHGFFLPPNTQSIALKLMAELARVQASVTITMYNRVLDALFFTCQLLEETGNRVHNPGRVKLSTALSNRLMKEVGGYRLDEVYSAGDMVSSIVSEWVHQEPTIILKPAPPDLSVQEEHPIKKIPDGNAVFYRVEVGAEAHAQLGELGIDFNSCFSTVGENASNPFRIYGGYPSFIVYLSSSPELINGSLKDALQYIEVRWWGMAGHIPIVRDGEKDVRNVPFIFSSNAYSDANGTATPAQQLLTHFYGTSAVRKGEAIIACLHQMVISPMYTLGAYTGDVYAKDSPIINEDVSHRITNLYTNQSQQGMLIGDVSKVDWEASYMNLLARYRTVLARLFYPGDEKQQRSLLIASNNQIIARLVHKTTGQYLCGTTVPFTERHLDGCTVSSKRNPWWQRYQNLIFSGFRHTALQVAESAEDKGYDEYDVVLVSGERDVLVETTLAAYQGMLEKEGLSPMMHLFPAHAGGRTTVYDEGFIRCADCGGTSLLSEARNMYRWLYFHMSGYSKPKNTYYPRRHSLCLSCVLERVNPIALSKPKWSVDKTNADAGVDTKRLFLPSGYENRHLTPTWGNYREQSRQGFNDAATIVHAQVHTLVYNILRPTLYAGLAPPDDVMSLLGPAVTHTLGKYVKANLAARFATDVVHTVEMLTHPEPPSKALFIARLNDVGRVLARYPEGDRFQAELHLFLTKGWFSHEPVAPRHAGWDEQYLSQFDGGVERTLSDAPHRRGSGGRIRFTSPIDTLAQINAGEMLMGHADAPADLGWIPDDPDDEDDGDEE